MNNSMDDAGCCLLSVAWNIAPLLEPSPTSRRSTLRATIEETCRLTGHAARSWASCHGTGTEPEYRPFLQLADVAYETATLLLLVGDSLVPDLEREHRRWAEIEGLMSRLEELSDWTSSFLGSLTLSGHA
ncbi:hypothetical protein OHS58_11570 [Amycolatopsis sp. NBC_00348]|uniref:hypothetical protein n=1 Tax=Amycolatopsis sp. NBC_00348 TaxID=2975956 RepID=UPI002E2596F4